MSNSEFEPLPCNNRSYRPLPILGNREKTEEILNYGSVEELIVLPLAVGENFPDWKYAQDVCLRLAEHPSDTVRANACLGLAYVARTKQRLEKHLIKPILLHELHSQTQLRWWIKDAIGDINYCLDWHLAHKHKAE